MTILVVDDASIMRMILKDILMRYGQFSKSDIIEAAGGEEAIRKYKEHMPELVLCDIAMPDMSGVEVVKVLKQFNPDANIIMCTASTDKEDVKACVHAGAKDYIYKPPKPERVIKAIEAITGKTLGGGVEKPDRRGESAGGNMVTRKEFDELKAEVDRLRGIVEGLGK